MPKHRCMPGRIVYTADALGDHWQNHKRLTLTLKIPREMSLDSRHDTLIDDFFRKHLGCQMPKFLTSDIDSIDFLDEIDHWLTLTDRQKNEVLLRCSCQTGRPALVPWRSKISAASAFPTTFLKGNRKGDFV